MRIIVGAACLAEREILPDERCCAWRWRIFSAGATSEGASRFGPDVSAGATAQQVTIYYTIF